MEIELGAVLRALRKWFWVPLVLIVLMGGFAYGIARNQDKVYTATSTLVVELPSGATQNASAFSTATQLSDPYELMLDTEAFRSRIAEQAGLPSIDEVEIKIGVPSGSRFINVQATHADPETALLIANTTADVIHADHNAKTEARLADTTAAINEEIASLNNEREAITDEIASLEESDQSGSARQIQLTGQLNRLDQRIADTEARADRMRLDYQLSEPRLSAIKYEAPPTEPDNTSPLLVALLGAFLGGIIGAGFIMFWAMTNNTISHISEWPAHSDAPVISEIPHAGTLGDGGKNIFILAQPTAAPAEGIRMLVTGLDFAGFPTTDNKVIQVTSPGPSDGKSTVSANLAVHFAQLGKNVLLVDCDLHRPRLHSLFSVPPDQGLTTLLMNKGTQVRDLAARVALPGLTLLPSGPLVPNPAEVYSSRQFAEAIQSFREEYDVVILDTPPILLFSDTRRIAARTDVIIAVGRLNQTKIPDMQQTLDAISETNAKFLGTVWVGSKPTKEHYYYRERRKKRGIH